MHNIFKVTSKDIQNLDDSQARELVSRLCEAELKIKGLPSAFVTWGGDQRAIDGGVDVRVNIDPAVGISGYIPKDATVFQVKAEEFPQAKILKEMAPLGKLRPAIKELASKNGAYIIVSSRDNTSDKFLAERKKVMASCLSTHRLTGKIALDFYDSRKIADWVEQHPAIVIWLKSILGKPIDGWQPYAAWAYRDNDIKAEYLLDDKVKVFTPNADEGISITTAIDNLRNDLSKNVSVRIVGLSGVGKTRLVQALFDDRINTKHLALDCKNVIYTDLSNNPTPQPRAMIESLLLEGADCIVVVDNCGPDVHQKLTELVKHPNSKLRLITVEYDIRDDLPEHTTCYRLEGSSDEIIKTLLKRHYPILSENDIDKIAEFSAGNARVAFALASTSETKGELARLEDEDLFKRLFVQKNTESDELLRCAEVASLLYSFDIEDISENSELAILASLAEVTVLSFSRNIAQLLNRGLVQKRGKWRAVLPHAISNRLALHAVENYPKVILVTSFIDRASERVARSFSRRLGYLHESKCAREIADDWLSSGGLLGDLTKLSDISQQIFANIAPVDQKASLSALQRATESKVFVSTSNHNRGHFARIVRSLAYEPDLFNQALEILTRFALEEPEGYNSDSTRDMLKSLFFCHLSGTEAPPKQRAIFVKRLIESDDNAKQKLGLQLLTAALEATHFSSHHGFDFGARKRGYGWWPRTHDEIRDWYQLFINIAINVGINNSEIGKNALTILGNSLPGLWANAGLVEELTAAAQKLIATTGWPEGWLGIRQTLHWHKKNLTEQSLKALKALEQELAPQDLNEKIQAKVLARGSFTFDLDYDSDDEKMNTASQQYHRAFDESKELGKEAATDKKYLFSLLPDLLIHNTNNKIFHFGCGIGESASYPKEILSEAKKIIVKLGLPAISLMFIRGLISGWNTVNTNEVSTFLDEAVSDEIWGISFPELQTQVVLDSNACTRLMKSLELKKAPSWQFKYLSFGCVTDTLSVEQVSLIIDAVAAIAKNGLSTAIDVLYMVIYSSKEKNEEYRSELTQYSLKFLQKINWSAFYHSDHHDQNLSYHLNEIIKFALSSGKFENEASIILSKLTEFERSKERAYAYRKGDLLKKFFKYYPILTLNSIYIPDMDGKYSTALSMITDWGDELNEKSVIPITADAFIEWCEISPNDRYLFAAMSCQLIDNSKSENINAPNNLALSDISKRILVQARDKNAVIEIFINRIYLASHRGSLAENLRRRLPLLDELNPTKDEKIRDIITNKKDELIKRIAAQEKFENDNERNQTGSFE